MRSIPSTLRSKTKTHRIVCGKNERKKVEAVPLSNDVIHSRIVEMSSNVLKQVIEELNASPFPFSMQLDESTDVSQCSQLLVFVRYVKHDTRSIKEEFLLRLTFRNYEGFRCL
ncbi:Protein ZBED8 [Eumeta japonica]|uniref:Protein ZBED8 n=1 Tax=Eumeta variegata TaxID=151549 RepID=A0A4C1T8A7_EUMVA|nr:Protein ZBED8 [Eumeta japonica]